MSEPLAFTGERFIPGVRGEIWIEHWHRYHFAARWAAGKRTVDAACGEGYGSALLARSAASVTGVDIAGDAVASARARYADRPNLRFVAANCAKLPLAGGAAELFVSFETLEHIGEQEAFLDEIARVLAPEGVLLLSCPNRLEYSDRRAFTNAYHVKELYREELAALLDRRFAHTRWYGQRPSFFSVIAPEAPCEAGHLAEVGEAAPAEAGAILTEPLYFLVAASRSAAALAAVPATLSVLADRDDWVHRDYEKVMRDLNDVAARSATLTGEVAQLAGAREAAIASRDEVLARLRDLEVRLARAGEDLSAREQTIAAREREIVRRGGLRWWLRLPFERLFGRSSRG